MLRNGTPKLVAAAVIAALTLPAHGATALEAPAIDVAIRPPGLVTTRPPALVATQPPALVATTGAAPAGLAAPTATTPKRTAAWRLIRKLNNERARRGLDRIDKVRKVKRAAAFHSFDMAAHTFMSHTGSDGSNTGDRLDRAGFRWRGWGENIGAGYPNAGAMFEGWMNSPGHRTNMLANWEYVGVRVVKSDDGVKYWTMVLANNP